MGDFFDRLARGIPVDLIAFAFKVSQKASGEPSICTMIREEFESESLDFRISMTGFFPPGCLWAKHFDLFALQARLKESSSAEVRPPCRLSENLVPRDSHTFRWPGEKLSGQARC